MRWLLLLVLVTPAFAETRIGVHLGAGLEAGTMQGEPRPDVVGEAGIGLDHYFTASWGAGVVLEAVGRRASHLEIAEELKLDVIARYRFPGVSHGTLGFGAGVRWLTIEGNSDRPQSTIRGVDMLRMESEFGIANTERFSLDFYFAWTIGFYSGEMRGTRYGDMPYPTQDVRTLANSYVLGLKTTYSM